MLSLVTVHIFRVLSARGKHESSVSKTGRTRDRLEDPFQRSSIDRQFAILLARYFFMYRPSSKLSGKPRIVRRSVASTPSLPPRVSAQVRGCCIGAPSSPLAQLGKEGTKRRDERFPLFIHRARLERSRRKREIWNSRIIQLG